MDISGGRVAEKESIAYWLTVFSVCAVNVEAWLKAKQCDFTMTRRLLCKIINFPFKI